MNRFLPLLTCLLILESLFSPGTYAQEYEVTVAAGPTSRLHSVVSFDWPQTLDTEDVGLFTTQGDRIPLQRFNNKAWFILDQLDAETTVSFYLKKAQPSSEGSVRIQASEGAISFSRTGNEILTYQSKETELPRKNIKEAFKRGGYIHPVQTPSGITITDDYPRNHIHHHGIWSAWTKTNFEGRSPDFWNMGNRTGKVIPVALDSTWTGPVFSGLQSRHHYIDLSADDPVPVLEESWEIRVYDVPLASPRPYYLFDLHVVHRTYSDAPLQLPKYRYGGVGFRGHWDWNGAKNTFFLTSEGKNRSNGHATTAEWCHIGGYVDDSFAGVAILSHPSNFRHPQPMRIHPTEPFFNWAPSQAGDWAITSDTPYVATYRFVVMDGAPDAELYDRLFQDFASPPSVTVSPVQ